MRDRDEGIVVRPNDEIIQDVLDEEGLEAALGDLEASSQWSPRLISRLEKLIRTGNDLTLFRLNPIRYAHSEDIHESESIDLFLHATRAGLFEMEWNVVCISCGNVFRSFRNLEKVDPHFHCNLCDMENEASLDELIQVTFTVSPRIRDIILHHPGQLTIEQLLFEFQYSQEAMEQYDGLTLPELLRSWTRALQYIEPGEEAQLTVDPQGGALVVRDLQMSASLGFIGALDQPPTEHLSKITLGEHGFSHPNLEVTEFRLETPVGSVVFPNVHFIGPGPIEIRCTNTSEERVAFWALHYPPVGSFEIQAISFNPLLSAKRLLSTETFRKLFRAEAPKEGESLSVNDLTYLFTDLQGSTAMYDEVGDATAYNLVRLHFDVITKVVADNDGAVVKTVGDSIMATFIRPADAVSSAIQMLENLREFNATMSSDLMLKIGIHRGHSIAVTLNQRLDYFGQNVNIAARTQQLAGPGEILVSQDVADEAGVAQLLVNTDLEPASGVMRGIAEEIAVFRVSV